VKRSWISAGLAAATLAGCVHYAPSPPHPEQFSAALEARRLDEKPAGAVWSRADLLAAALSRNSRVTEAKAKYLTAVAAARAAKQAPGLTLTLTAEYADETPRWGYGAAADVPVDGGARRGARMTTADLQALQAWYDYGEAVWAVRTALEKARIELEAADAATALADRAASLRRERLQRLERRTAAGEDDRTATLIAQTDLAAAERRLADAGGRRDQATVALAKALGVGPGAARGLVLAPMGGPPPLDALPTWRRDAALFRSDVLRAVVDYDLSENALRLEVARQYPEVRIGPGYNYDHGINKLPLNISLILPSYDLNRAAIGHAEAARIAAGRSLEAVQADALAAVDTAASALSTAQANLQRITARELPAARATAAGVARSVDAGEADRVDDLAARAAELDAELNLLDARRAVWAASSDLEDALRRSFDPSEGAVLQSAMTRPGGSS
jgi:CRISPR system Cascade subunit CasA